MRGREEKEKGRDIILDAIDFVLNAPDKLLYFNEWLFRIDFLLLALDKLHIYLFGLCSRHWNIDYIYLIL